MVKWEIEKLYLFIPVASLTTSAASCALAFICCPASCIDSLADWAASLALSIRLLAFSYIITQINILPIHSLI